MSKYCLAERLPARVRRSLQEQTAFGGLEGHPGATGDKLRSMENMSSSAYPALSVREGRRIYHDALKEPPNGAIYHRYLYVASGTYLYYIRDNGSILKLNGLSNTPKRMTVLDDKIYIFPDKVIFDTQTSRWIPMEVDIVCSGDFTWTENTLTYEGMDWAAKGISAGDKLYVTAYGSLAGVTETQYCKVLAVSGNSLTLDTKPAMSAMSYRFFRSVPNLEGVCAVKNRLWGYVGRYIYASEEGQPLNFYVAEEAERLSAESPVLMETGTVGGIYACISWQGYPVFFKEDCICKVIGSGARQFELSEVQTQGVTADTGDSLCNIEGRVYYATKQGVYAYDGTYPQRIPIPFPLSPKTAVGGSDGRIYYLSCEDDGGNRTLYTYDPACRTWHVQEAPKVAYMVSVKNALCMVTSDQKVIYTDGALGRDTEITKNDQASVALQAFVEFGDEVCCLDEGIRLHKLYLSCASEADSVLTVSVSYDGDKKFATIATLTGARDGWTEIVVPATRCKYYRLRLDMNGPWRIYAIHREYERGRQG